MLRLRSTTGEVFDIDPAKWPFAEVVNELDGTIGKLMILSEPGALIEVYPNSSDAQRYEAIMGPRGAKFASMIIHRKSV